MTTKEFATEFNILYNNISSNASPGLNLFEISSYLTKYMLKSSVDGRLAGKSVFRSSRNVIRPLVIKGDLLSSYYYGTSDPDLSTASLLSDRSFMLEWLGKGRHQLFRIKL